MSFRQTAIVTTILISSFATAPTIFAVTPTTVSMPATQEATTPASVEYTLPYPGILPDHPLYFLKRLRDQIMERLIADPARKTEFYMLQADKQINMGVFLAAKKKEELSQETLESAHKYFDLAVTTAAEFKSQGKEVPPYLIERFTNAGAKYKEVLVELMSVASDAQKTSVMTLIDSLDKMQEKVAQFK